MRRHERKNRKRGNRENIYHSFIYLSYLLLMGQQLSPQMEVKNYATIIIFYESVQDTGAKQL